MKKYILLSLVLLPFLSFAQSRYRVFVSGNGGPGSSNGLQGYANEAEMRTDLQVAMQNTIYFLDNKPGQWRYDAGDDSSVDNTGTTIVTNNGQRIKRVIDDGVIQIDWFNVQKGEIDDAPAVNAAFDYARSNPSIIYTIQFGVGQYRFVTAIDTIDFNCTIDGTYFNTITPATEWWFYGNVPGIVIRAAVTMRNIHLRKVFYNGGYDKNMDGIDVSTVCHFNGVIVNGFPGDGFNIHGDGSGPLENTDQSTFINTKARENRGHGYVMYGGDANIIQFLNSEAVSNGGAGWCDNGFLGNNYINCHTASNGGPETGWQKALCIYAVTPGDTVLYYALHNANTQGDATTLDPPGPGSTDWAAFPRQDYAWTHSPYVKYYHEDSTYLSGGGYVLDWDNFGGSNQFSTLIGCYSEADNPPSRWGPKTISIGGDLRPAGIYSGLDIAAFNNYLDVFTRFQAKYDDYLPVTQIANDALIMFKSVSDNTGGALQFDTTRRSIYWRDYATYSPNSNVAASGGSEIFFPGALGSRLGRSTNDFAWNTINPTLFLDDANTGGDNYKQVSMGSAAPVSGTYSTGDIRLRSVTTTGQSLGWRCVAGGTPGTWEEITGSSGVNASDYTPVKVDIANISSSTSNFATWMRVGDYIHVSGSITVTTTSTSTLSQIDISLPVTSDFSSTTQLNGTANSLTVFGYVTGNTTNDRARIEFTSPASGSTGTIRYSFMYKIVSL